MKPFMFYVRFEIVFPEEMSEDILSFEVLKKLGGEAAYGI